MLQVETIPAFRDNYIWALRSAESQRAVIVDPGEAGPVLEAAQRGGWTPSAILITHHHNDHTGGIAALRASYPVPVYGPRSESIPGVTEPLDGGERLDLDGIPIEVIATPGHTRGHLSYLCGEALFCGDTLFAAGCGRLFEGTPEQMHQSLQRLAVLPPQTRVYCAHEYTLDNLAFARIAEPENPAIERRLHEARDSRAANLPTVPSQLGEELETNPFLRCQEPTLIRNAAAFCGRTLHPGAETFAVVRCWKDTLD